MPVFYLDTSALVKRYRTEQGTEIVQQLFDNPSPEDRFFISFFSIIELLPIGLTPNTSRGGVPIFNLQFARGSKPEQ